MDINRRLVSACEAAADLGIAASTLYGLARQRKIPFVRLGDRLLFNVEEIIELSRVPAENGKAQFSSQEFKNPKSAVQR
jgi:excisionase family DNA binding protein